MKSPIRALEISKLITLSTAHLGESIATGKPAPINAVASMSGEHGWLVYTGHTLESYRAHLKGDAAPSAIDVFIDLMHWARMKGARYVLFDSDGPTVSGFPTYDW